MFFALDFDGNSEIGVYVRLTNKYIIVGQSENRALIDFFRDNFSFPVVETTINAIKAVGRMCVGNSNALILPDTCTDQELQHIRNSLPPTVDVVRIQENLNCLGNLVCCNDHVCLVSPDLDDETMELIGSILKVPVYRNTIGDESLVGTYAVMNSHGMLTGPNVNHEQLEELSRIMNVQVIAGTVNSGSGAVGGGVVVNDWAQIMGRKCTNVEIKVAGSIFNLSQSDISEQVLLDEVVQ